MDKKEQSPFCKRKCTTPKKWNVKKFELGWKTKNWLLQAKRHGLARMFLGK